MLENELLQKNLNQREKETLDIKKEKDYLSECNASN